MPTTTLPPSALLSTCESPTAALTWLLALSAALLTAPLTLSFAEDTALPTSAVFEARALCAAVAALEAVVLVLLPQPDTTSASAAAPATAEAILANLIRVVPSGGRRAGRSRPLISA